MKCWQAAESKAKSMEMEVEQLQQRLESKSSEAQSSDASVGKQVKMFALFIFYHQRA